MESASKVMKLRILYRGVSGGSSLWGTKRREGGTKGHEMTRKGRERGRGKGGKKAHETMRKTRKGLGQREVSSGGV